MTTTIPLTNHATRPASTSTSRLKNAERDELVLAHGGGGQLTDELLHDLVLPRLGNDVLSLLDDAAVLPGTGSDRLALTIDGYVVHPWRFPGGDIGKLAVCGTINDLAAQGAEPVAIALGVVAEEGFSRSALASVLDSVAEASRAAGVPVVTGDTKVVGRGQADGLYLTTAGVGRKPLKNRIDLSRVHAGDLILINGPVADHGLAVMIAREMPEVTSVLRSDAAALHGLIGACLHRLGSGVVFMRDATRGGLAGVVADLAAQTGHHVSIDEEAIPLRPETRHAADMLGLDPLDVANEGKVIMVVRPEAAEHALQCMQRFTDPALGRDAAIIGRVEAGDDGICELRTTIGGRRIIQKPYGESLPRIC